MAPQQVILCEWHQFGKYIILDPNSGDCAHFIPPENETRPAHGYGCKFQETLAAIYSVDGELSLFVAGKQICCSAKQEVSVQVQDLSRRKRAVTLDSGTERIWAAVYEIPELKLRRLPTYDSLDEEASDFWLFISRQLPNPTWQTKIAQLWSDGIGWS